MNYAPSGRTIELYQKASVDNPFKKKIQEQVDKQHLLNDNFPKKYLKSNVCIKRISYQILDKEYHVVAMIAEKDISKKKSLRWEYEKNLNFTVEN